jgi:hypothetical protein
MVYKPQAWSLIEAIVALAIFALVAASLISLSAGSLNPWLGRGANNQAEALAESGLEAARAIRDRAWNEFIFSKSALNLTGATWSLVGENTEETIGVYTRYLEFKDVCRDATGQISPCPAARLDPHIQEVTATVKWGVAPLAKQVARTVYLANWDSRFWEQADWSGGDGQTIWQDRTKYDSGQNVDTTEPGAVKLAKTSGVCQPFTWTFDQAGDYNYDPNKIEVVASQAQLKALPAEYKWHQPILDDRTLETVAVAPSPNEVKVADNVTLGGQTVDVYAAVYRTSALTGKLRTWSMTDQGAVVNQQIDTFIFDATRATAPDIFPVSGNIFGIAYSSQNNRGRVVTIRINNNGTINKNLIDNYIFDARTTADIFALPLPNNIYAFSYRGSINEALLATVRINTSGIITKSTLDSLTFGATANWPRLTAVAGTTYAAYYSDTVARRGYLKTVSIDDAGQISNQPLDTFNYDDNSGTYKASLVKVGGQVYALSYNQSNNNSLVKTLTIQDNGTITKSWLDSLSLGTTFAGVFIEPVFGPWFVVNYTVNYDGWVGLLNIAPDGQMGNQFNDAMVYNPQTVTFPFFFKLTDEVYGLVYRRNNTDLQLTTLKIESISSGFYTDGDIAAKNPYAPGSVDAWTGFSEVATKNGGEIYYQLSDDNGATWYYWNGSVWAPAGATNYNTVSEVNTNIWQFSSAKKSLAFKAWLHGTGSQTVALDEVKVDCGSLQLEVGRVQADSNWTRVNFINTYVKPVIIASHRAANNTLPASVRVDMSTGNYFSIRLENPSRRPLNNEEITYLVIEEGVWNLGGQTVEARQHYTSTLGRSGNWLYDQLAFKHKFTAEPLVFHQVMSANDNRWITSYVSNYNSRTNPPDATGLRIALNGAEAATSHGQEVIGYVAIARDTSGQVGGNAWETYRTTDSVRGYDDGCYPFNYRGSYSAPPLTIASQEEQDDDDGSWAVMCANSATAGSFYVDEDQVRDNERSNSGETLGFISFDHAGSYSSGGSYSANGWLLSSAFNLGQPSKIQVIEWTGTVGAGTGLKFQARAAADKNGSPDKWGAWYGAAGVGTYFTLADGSLISTDLNGQQWVQYRVELSGDGSATPILNKVKINYK